MQMFKRISRLRFPAATVLFVGTSFTAVCYWYRPLPDRSNGRLGPNRKDEYFISSESLTELAGKPLPILLKLCRKLSGVINVSFFRIYMNLTGSVKIRVDSHYLHFVESVVHRDTGVPLLSVSNHRSMADDPGAMSCILPYYIQINPKYIRWSLCAQDFCFNEKFPQLIYGLCGSFKVLPMWRGGGLNQKLLYDYARLCHAGEWLHMFPEGGVWQNEELGGRKSGAEKLGKLKWGVGKLIAHATKKPIVIPFHIKGTEHIVPQDNETKRVLFKYPIIGHKVEILFGEQIFFDDLLEEHERLHGPIRKFDDCIGFGNDSDFHEHWDSFDHDYELYNKITFRIQESLEILNERCKNELQ